ncbi:MAG: hydantoinase/oxoprolinase family protein [Betaproteobacteria bacterium]
MSAEGYALGVDVGGTFTDIALIRISDGQAFFHKTSSTPSDPSAAVAEGVSALLAQSRVNASEVRYFGHGTTVATNAVITGRTARTGLITTKGFRDVLDIRRQRQPHTYDIRIDKPAALVPRHLRKELRERVYLSGDPALPPDIDALQPIIADFKRQGVEAVAVCFLHSYARPEHEALVARAVQDGLPEAFICSSHEVLAEFREYERISTTVLNAALGPVMSRYLNRLAALADAMGLVAPKIQQSNGGVSSARDAGANAVRTLVSGPAAGVTGATQLAVAAGAPDIITFDVGGTSTDVCLIQDGRPLIARQREFHRYPVRFPMVDVHSVGAGGGSIAWVDDGGFLRVGPQSAGAVPGPACYGLGGESPTVTDANVVLGRLPGDALLGGRMPIDASLARKAIEERIAVPMGLSVEDAAQGILTILNENMMRAIRVISVEKGYDPRNFTLVAFGGAGPLLASALAFELGISRVMVPPHPGLLCAHGLLVADVRADFSLSRIGLLNEAGADGLNGGFAELERRAADWFSREGVPPTQRRVDRSLDLRFAGQSHELTVPIASKNLQEVDLSAIVTAFQGEHMRVFGYAPDGQVQIVTYRLSAHTPVAGAPRHRPVAQVKGSALTGSRRAHFQGIGFVDCPIYDRSLLEPQKEVRGPAIMEQMDTTTVVLPGQIARAQSDGILLLTFI